MLTDSITKCSVLINYCGTIQNIEEQCGYIFIADVYVKIFEDNLLNNFAIHLKKKFTDIYRLSSNKIEDSL